MHPLGNCEWLYLVAHWRSSVPPLTQKTEGSDIGKITGDKELQSEGKLDKTKGDVHNAVGDVKDAARKLTK